MKVRSTKDLVFEDIHHILLRGTNWIGDVIMTLPALAAVRETVPHAKISVLAKPWVGEVYANCSDVDEVITYHSPGRHDGVKGKYRLAGELKKETFDMAILLQNAIEAAILTWLARIPIRAGYDTDGRRLLLTHSVKRTREIRKVHQIDYYVTMLESLGFRSSGRHINLVLSDEYPIIAQRVLSPYGVHGDTLIVGIAPGAAYGPAKMWFPERFSAVADTLVDDFGAMVVLFGSGGDRERADRVQQHARHRFINMAGETSLKEVAALISRCDLFISNDSGLMHLAGALDIPLVAIFGSTNPVTTSPVGENSIVVHKDVACSPCLKKECPTDFKCMDLIAADDVYSAAKSLLTGHAVKAGTAGRGDGK